MNDDEITQMMGLATQAQPGAALMVDQAKAVAEVQGAMVIAKRFPRDAKSAALRILEACRRPLLAEQALYTYPKGHTTVTGPSIRLAEAMAQQWGNMDFGVRELVRDEDSSLCQAYAVDIETNTRRTIEFHVPHRIDLKDGKVKYLTSARDIYELVANMGSRRLRACVLAIIPGDIEDMAIREVHKTLANANDEPISDRIVKMLDIFKTEFGVSKEMIEARFQHNVEAISEPEMVTLKGIYRSLKDGMSTRDQHFSVSGESTNDANDLSQALKADAQQAESAALSAHELLRRIASTESMDELDMVDSLVRRMSHLSTDEADNVLAALNERGEALAEKAA